MSAESNSILRQSDEDEISNSGDAVDDFKDFDPNSEEKLFGVDLFDELPMNERRVRFEETVSLDRLKNKLRNMRLRSRKIAEDK